MSVRYLSRMRIRKMRVDDAEGVSRLAGQLGHPASAEEIRRRFAAMAQHGSSALYVACDEAERVLGWVQVHREEPSLLAEGRAEISALVVDEEARSGGIGARLLEMAEGWARQEGLSLMRVRSNTIRERAHGFYQRRGYGLEKSWHLFTKRL